MKKLLFGVVIFGGAFIAGSVFTLLFTGDRIPGPADPIGDQIVRESEPAPAAPAESGTEPEFTNFPDIDDIGDIDYRDFSGNLVDLMEGGGTYRKSEVVAKSGEVWLGLFEENGKYSLVRSRATVTNLDTGSFPGDELDVTLSFDRRSPPLFALRKLRSVKAGPVPTSFHGPSTAEIDTRRLWPETMEIGYERSFAVNETWFTLRVSQGLTRNGETISVLVLEERARSLLSQVIRSQVITQNYTQYIGDLRWAGDLDDDGKLDLYFDEYNESGAFVVSLYLSSQADPGKLVKLAAMFGRAGC